MSTGLLGDDEQLTGEVVGLIYADPDGGFGVVELESDTGPGARCSGPLADLVEGQQVSLSGRWRDHPRYGRTFEAVYYEQLTPTTVAGVKALLDSDRFGAVDEQARTRVITTFGEGAGRVIEQEPQRLRTEAGVPDEVADELHRAWMTGLAQAHLVRLVAAVDWPMDAVRRVHARFGADAVRTAREDPYRLLEADRVGFAHVDALALHLGVERSDPERLAAGARAAVASARRQEGHQHLSRERCAEATSRLLGVDRLLADEGIDAAVVGGMLAQETIDDEVVVSTPEAFAAERALAAGIARLIATRRSRLRALGEGRQPPSELTDGQARAVRAVFDSPVSVLTGGPGTGKTRTIQEVVAAAEDAELEVALCAPTGRAAKRLEELVGRAATTVHRLLAARPTGSGGFAFRHGEDEPLPHDLVVVDEISMCDTWLARHLVAAVDDGAHLLLVGDADQLPSVGPGDVVRDLVRCGCIPVTTLTEIHRQAAGSRIVGLAREVLSGEVAALRPVDGDVFLAEEPRRDAIVARVVAAVAERAPERFGVAVEDVQVLAPIYRGPAGVDALNDGLKDTLNPAGQRPGVAGFRVGDRVLQTRNDPELDVANGDVGTVVDLARRPPTLRVGFPRGEVTYTAAQARDLAPAWALTVHKAQGGEWPVVVLVLDASHRSMLWRNLVYTAITRAQRALIVVGQQAALEAAARQDRPRQRRTGLAWRLQQLLDE